MSDEMNFNKYKKLIKTFTRKTYNLIDKSVVKEDLYQIFCLSYSKSLESYKEHRGESFYNYLRKNLVNKLKKIFYEYKVRDISKEGGSFAKQNLFDKRIAPINSVTCIFCHKKGRECYLDKKDDVEDWESSCDFYYKDSYTCEKWIKYRYDNQILEVELNEDILYDKEPQTEDISILMADCRKFLNEREMRIVRYIIESPEGHLDFMQVCENEGVSHTVIARTLSKLKEKMKIILDKG